MNMLSWFLLTLALMAYAPAETGHITITSDDAFVARLQLPPGADVMMTTYGDIHIETESGVQTSLRGTGPQLRLVGHLDEIEGPGKRRFAFSEPVKVRVRQGSLNLIYLNLDRAEITLVF